MADIGGRKRMMVRDDQGPNKSLFGDTKKSINMLLNDMEEISREVKQITTNENFKISDIVTKLSELFNIQDTIRVNIRTYLNQIKNEDKDAYRREYGELKTQIQKFIKMPKEIISELFGDLSSILETINDKFNIVVSILVDEFINNPKNKINTQVDTEKKFIDKEINESNLTYSDITYNVKNLVTIANRLLGMWNDMNADEQLANAADYAFQLKQLQRSLVVIYLPKMKDKLREVYDFQNVYISMKENKVNFQVPLGDQLEDIIDNISNSIAYAEKVNESFTNNVRQIEDLLN